MREGWEYKRWADVLTIINGKNQKAVESPNGQYPIYGSGGIMGYALDWLCPENCVIIGRKGNINKPLFVESKFWNVDTAFGLSANQECLIPKYLFYFCLDYNFERHNRAVTIPSLTKIDLLKVKMLVPPKPTQLSIVSELDKLNELIRIKKEQLKDYDALAQSIFYEMFGDPVENEKGWEVKELIETVIPECKISYGIVQPGEHVEDGVPIVRPVDMLQTFISKDGLKKTTKEISNSYNRTILTGKELLICVRGTTGVVSLVDESLKGANVTRGIAPLLFSMDVERWFMYYQIKTPSVRGVISSLTRGIALKQINMSDLRKIQVILPPLPLQQSFAQKIEQIEQQKAAIQKTITDLETLLAARMQYWFD